ncbi:MAG: glycosyltransferase family 2 protein [Acidobacteria bacterium]|nr:glycosyltransferase family 2 protein [Acidobacteriota bacterium]
MSCPDLSIVVPTYNEAEIITATLEEIASHLRRLGVRGEILVADDGSNDATLARARAASLSDTLLRLLPAQRNRGKGDAVRRGVLAARGRFVLFTDADLSTPLTELDRFLRELEAGHPLVIGSRKLEPQRVVRRQPWPRQFMGRVFSWLARRLLNPEVADFTCGFKAFRREVVDTLFTPLTLAGWAFDAELLHVARRRRIPVLELPVAWANRGATRVRLRRDILVSAAGLLRVVWNGWRGRYAPRPDQST